MTYRVDRRSFLRIALVTAGCLPACSDDDDPSTDPADRLRVFPQGLASGDPKPDSVILWTRVEPEGESSVSVKYEVATDEAFASLVSSGEQTVDASTDHTLRLKVVGLGSYTTYYYRFIARDVISDHGRTKTAPAPDQDVSPRFGFASCQDFNGRYYHAWRALTEEQPDLDFVLYLGDYIYETEGDPRFQDPTEARKVVLPDGLPIGDEEAPYSAALTLADYRTLYKTYRGDADLKRAHALYPFIAIWDDHEFADDCWQDHATHFNEAQGDEKNAERRHASSQAWFEYQPADVEFNGSGSFPEDIQIYRTLRYGKHVEIILTDQRYYRDDHLIPEGPMNDAVGKIFENDGLGSRQLLIKEGFDPLEAAAKPTMLGDTQKAWFIDAVNASDATWKFWGNETQLAQMCLDLTEFEQLPESFRKLFYFTVDQWDGYRSERAEILGAVAGTRNLVALTGDIHAFFACEIRTDPDVVADDPVCVEYTTAGISSSSVQDITARIVEGNEVLNSLGLGDLVASFDTILQAASPHYLFSKSDGYGVSFVEVDADNEIRVTFLEVADSTTKTYGGVINRYEFRTPSGTPAVEAV
jgi:alkaline phosphatase D